MKKVGTAHNLADLGTKSHSAPAFIRLVGLNMMDDASSGRTLPEQRVTAVFGVVDCMANDSRIDKIARVVMTMITEMVKLEKI
eukprot:12814012-Heterocapsa_arctica.AAC.1